MSKDHYKIVVVLSFYERSNTLNIARVASEASHIATSALQDFTLPAIEEAAGRLPKIALFFGILELCENAKKFTYT